MGILLSFACGNLWSRFNQDFSEAVRLQCNYYFLLPKGQDDWLLSSMLNIEAETHEALLLSCNDCKNVTYCQVCVKLSECCYDSQI